MNALFQTEDCARAVTKHMTDCQSPAGPIVMASYRRHAEVAAAASPDSGAAAMMNFSAPSSCNAPALRYRDAAGRYPGVAAHLAACGPCGEDFNGLLLAVTRD